MNIRLNLIAFSCLFVSAKALITCQQANIDNCLSPFRKEFDAGTGALKKANESTIAQVCWRYDVVSKCLIPIVFYCPEVYQNLQRKIEEFEYFCSNIPKSPGQGWPFRPTSATDQDDEMIEKAEAEKTKQKTIDNAIKASIAAVVTIFLVMICVAVDCYSRWKIRRKVNKAIAASNAAAAEQEKEKLRKQEEEKNGNSEKEGLVKKV